MDNNTQLSMFGDQDLIGKNITPKPKRKKIILTDKQLENIKKLNDAQQKISNNEEFLVDSIEDSKTLEEFITGLKRIYASTGDVKYKKTIHNTIYHLQNLHFTLSNDDLNTLNTHFNEIIQLLYRPDKIRKHAQISYIINTLTKIGEVGNFFKMLTDIMGVLNEKQYSPEKYHKVLSDVIELSENSDYDAIKKYLDDNDINPSTKYENSFKDLGYSIERKSPKIMKHKVDIIKQYIESIDSNYEEICDEIISHIDQYINEPGNDNDKYDIMYQGENIPNTPINKGDKIEVKQMGIKSDSYLSEFLSVGKASDWAKRFKKNPNLLDRYNDVIDCLYNKLSDNKQLSYNIIHSLMKNVKGIFFDEYIFVPKEYIEFYLSDKGLAGCNQRRLSIRFRLRENFTYFKMDDKSKKFTKHEDSYKPGEYTYCQRPPVIKYIP